MKSKGTLSDGIKGSSGYRPVITVISCLMCVIVPVLLCFVFVGPKTILEYAGRSRPYSILLDPAAYSEFDQSEDSTKIVCFGDSNYFYPPHMAPMTDKSQTYLPTLLHSELSKSEELSDVVISQRAFASAGMFDYYCMTYEAMKFSPDLIIVPINWRSFGLDEWDSFGMGLLDSSNWYHPELSALAPLRNEFLLDHEDPIKARGITLAKRLDYKLSLYALYPIGIRAWALENVKMLLASLRETLNPPAYAAELGNAGSISVADDKPVRAHGGKPTLGHISATYPMTIDASNHTFQSLGPLAHVASERGVKVLFFIWPIDHERFEQIGHLDKPSLDKSKKLIADAVQNENGYFLDLSDLLGHEYFFDSNGHCVVEGRRRIAKALAPKIAEILSESSDTAD